MKAGFPASSLFHLKEAWWMKYHDLDKKQLADLKARLMDVYSQLNKSELAEVMRIYFDWI